MKTGTAGRFRPGVSNHPGHGDQKSHGRSKGGGVRKELADAKTTEQVGAVLASKLTATMGHDVAVDLAGMDVQLAREHAEGLLQCAERFPNSRLANVDTYGPNGSAPSHPGDPYGQSHAVTTAGRYSANTDVISFNVGAPPDAYRAMLSAQGRLGDVAVGTPMGAAIHEFGHTLQHNSVPGAAGRVATESARAAGSKTSSHVAEHVSGYASSDAKELAAEAFADVMVNGSNASSLSQEIFAEIEGDYERNGASR